MKGRKIKQGRKVGAVSVEGGTMAVADRVVRAGCVEKSKI